MIILFIIVTDEIYSWHQIGLVFGDELRLVHTYSSCQICIALPFRLTRMGLSVNYPNFSASESCMALLLRFSLGLTIRVAPKVSL